MKTAASPENWKQKLESGFGYLGDIAFKHPIKSFITFILFAALIGFQLKNIRIDTTIEGFLSPNDPEIVQFEFFRDKFGRDEYILVAFEPENLFSVDVLKKLAAFQDKVETSMPHVWEVNSILNARNVYGQGDSLIVEELFETFPESTSDVAHIKNVAMKNPLYRNSVLSEDGKFTAMSIKLVPFYRIKSDDPDKPDSYEFLADIQMIEAMDGLYAILRDFPELNKAAYISGTTALTAEITRAINQDFAVFSVSALLVIALILYFIFRRPAAVFLPLLVMIVSTIITISIMAMTNTPFQMTTSILPSFLLAVCIGDSVHLLSVFFRRFDENHDRHEAVVFALRHAGIAMMFTSLTTAAGLASFATADITPIANLGIFGAIGALVAFATTVTMLPILIAVFKVKTKAINTHESEHSYLSDKFALFSTHLATEHYRKVLVVAAGLILLSIWALKDIRYSHNAMNWFPDDHTFKTSLEYIESRINGTMSLEVLIDTGKERGVINPEFLKDLDSILAELEETGTKQMPIAKTISFPTLVKETHQAIEGNSTQAYSIPDDPNLIAQLLLLVELDAGKELFKLIDGNYQWARSTIMVPWIDAVYYELFLTEIEQRLNAKLGKYGDVSITGMTPILGRTFAQMLRSTGQSYMIAGCVITLMMILLLGNLKLGLISMIPNLLPIIMVIAFMALSGAPMDMFSLLIGSIAIGLTVDDTVHFMHGFRRVYMRTGDVKKAIEDTLLSTGRAMIVTTIVLASGFSIYLLSAMNNMDDFGRLTAICVTLALFADFWLAPALMMLIYGKKTYNKSDYTP